MLKSRSSGGNDNGGVAFGLLDLPDECVERVLNKLNVEDVLSFQKCSRQCRDVGRDYQYWSRRLSNDYGLSFKVRAASLGSLWNVEQFDFEFHKLEALFPLHYLIQRVSAAG